MLAALVFVARTVRLLLKQPLACMDAKVCVKYRVTLKFGSRFQIYLIQALPYIFC